VHGLTRTNRDEQGRTGTRGGRHLVRAGPGRSVFVRELFHPGRQRCPLALELLLHLLDRQLASQARAFEAEGGFTERLYRTRQERRRAP